MRISYRYIAFRFHPDQIKGLGSTAIADIGRSPALRRLLLRRRLLSGLKQIGAELVPWFVLYAVLSPIAWRGVTTFDDAAVDSSLLALGVAVVCVVPIAGALIQGSAIVVSCLYLFVSLAQAWMYLARLAR